VFQALSPSFFSGLSDTVGRRPVLMLCLAMYCLACVAIALTPHDAYWMLLLFRCLQATGGSPALGTGSGAMGDIATPAERGTYMGLFTGAAMIGPSFGPVLGGILVEYLSWQWIFWVLAILCIVNLSVIFV
jgi:multidrug resistance protein